MAGEWVWNLKGVTPILYRLPELRRADRAETVWIVEGEQDADRLHSLGVTATTNPQGPGKWRQAFAREFRGRQVATGIRRSKRELHTSSRLHRRDISCMLSTTARTPRSLRRDDVSDRSLHFVLERLDAKRPEYEIQDEVVQMRDELMSDYARMVQLALRVPMDQVKVSDYGMRMADFARGGHQDQGLGREMKGVTDEAIALINTAQNRFATEESHLATLLEVWVDRFAPAAEGSMALGEFPNAGREVTPKELLVELRAIAREMT